MKEVIQKTHAEITREIINTLNDKFGQDCWGDPVYQESLWLAMQALCSPRQAAMVIDYCSVNRFIR